MNFGFVYIATNESFKNLIKVGFTSRNPQERLSELDTTGVPTPFNISYIICLKNAYEFEQLIHEKLSDYRKRDNREFFEIGLEEVISKIKNIIQENNIEIKFEELDENINVNSEYINTTSSSKQNHHEFIDDNNIYSKGKTELRTNGIDEEYLRREKLKNVIFEKGFNPFMSALSEFRIKDIAEQLFYMLRYENASVLWIQEGLDKINDKDYWHTVVAERLNFISNYKSYKMKLEIRGPEELEKEINKWLPFLYEHLNEEDKILNGLIELLNFLSFLRLRNLGGEIKNKLKNILSTNSDYLSYASSLYQFESYSEALKILETLMQLPDNDIDEFISNTFWINNEGTQICVLYIRINKELGSINGIDGFKTHTKLSTFCNRLKQRYIYWEDILLKDPRHDSKGEVLGKLRKNQDRLFSFFDDLINHRYEACDWFLDSKDYFIANPKYPINK